MLYILYNFVSDAQIFNNLFFWIPFHQQEHLKTKRHKNNSIRALGSALIIGCHGKQNPYTMQSYTHLVSLSKSVKHTPIYL